MQLLFIRVLSAFLVLGFGCLGADVEHTGILISRFSYARLSSPFYHSKSGYSGVEAKTIGNLESLFIGYLSHRLSLPLGYYLRV